MGNELALLAGCIPGIPLLQEIAAQTMVLAQDLVALVEGGILHRFPRIFSRGILTWDRWIWAASVHASRILPVSCFLNRGESAEDAFGLSSFSSGNQLEGGNCSGKKQMKQHSPPEIWDELGVMIPLLDMLNHQTDAAQVTWEPPSKQELLDSNSSINSGDTTSGGGDTNNNTNTQSKNQDNGAKVVMHKRVKKGSQVYTNYGYAKNNDLMLRYGFAQICNVSDTISIGWNLTDCVGKVDCPQDYIGLDDLVFEKKKKEEIMAAPNDNDNNNTTTNTNINKHLIYESTNSITIKKWWTSDRLSILQKEAGGPSSTGTTSTNSTNSTAATTSQF